MSLSISRAILVFGGLAAFGLTTAAPRPAGAQAGIPQPMQDEAAKLAKLCRADYEALCPGVVPGGGRVLACLETNATRLSLACARAMPSARSLKDRATAAGVLPE